MKPAITLLAAVMLVTLNACSSPAPDAAPTASPAAAPATAAAGLTGTSWRLVQISMSDGVTRPAIDRSRYTIGFGENDLLNVRFDCNRGRGSWKSSGSGQLEFGAVSLTRMACPMGSLHDELVRQWPYVRSYVIKDGRLYLSLMADGGTIEFEPSP